MSSFFFSFVTFLMIVLSIVEPFSCPPSHSGKEGAVAGIGLIVILRLWRVTRIVNGEFKHSGQHL